MKILDSTYLVTKETVYTMSITRWFIYVFIVLDRSRNKDYDRVGITNMEISTNESSRRGRYICVVVITFVISS